MSRFRKKPVVVEATQWFKMGDHPNVVPIVVQRYESSRLVETPGANIYASDIEYFPGMEATHGWLETDDDGRGGLLFIPATGLCREQMDRGRRVRPIDLTCLPRCTSP